MGAALSDLEKGLVSGCGCCSDRRVQGARQLNTGFKNAAYNPRQNLSTPEKPVQEPRGMNSDQARKKAEEEVAAKKAAEEAKAKAAAEEEARKKAEAEAKPKLYSDAEAESFWQMYDKSTKTLTAGKKLPRWSAERLQKLMDFLARETRDVTKLDMDNNELGDAGVAVVAQGLANLEKLEELWMDGNKMTAKGVTAMEESFPNLKKLRSLCMNGNQFGHAGATALGKAIANLENLQELFLNDNQFGDAGATSLGKAIANLENLQTLSLGYNQIGNAGATALAIGIANLENLEVIQLNMNKIQNPGYSALIKGFANLKKLKKVWLDSSPSSFSESDWKAMGFERTPEAVAAATRFPNGGCWEWGQVVPKLRALQ